MCECIKQMREPLKDHNAALDIPMTISGSGTKTVVATRKINTKKRQPLPVLFATYCPFCGRKYELADNSKA